MRISSDEKDIIDKISLLSGIKKADVRTVFETLSIVSALYYLNNESTDIPFIGNLSLSYEGEEFNKGTKKAIVTGEMDLNDYLKKMIGQIEDDDSNSDIEKFMKQKIYSSLGNYIDN